MLLQPRQVPEVLKKEGEEREEGLLYKGVWEQREWGLSLCGGRVVCVCVCVCVCDLRVLRGEDALRVREWKGEDTLIVTMGERHFTKVCAEP